jgi:hypothetical protein
MREISQRSKFTLQKSFFVVQVLFVVTERVGARIISTMLRMQTRGKSTKCSSDSEIALYKYLTVFLVMLLDLLANSSQLFFRIPILKQIFLKTQKLLLQRLYISKFSGEACLPTHIDFGYSPFPPPATKSMFPAYKDICCIFTVLGKVATQEFQTNI